MIIGCPNHPRRDLLEEVRWIGENGFRFVDLFLEPDRALPERTDVAELKRLLAGHRLSLVSHTAWYLPFGSPYPELRETAVKIVCGYLPFLQELGAAAVTVHANWASGLFDDLECVGFQLFALENLVREASRYGIRVLFEPMDTPRDTLENLGRILAALPDLRVHIDMGHAHVRGIPPEAFFRSFPAKVAHIHVHDNLGREDLHLPIGAGTIPWGEYIPQIRRAYDGTLSLEIFSPDREYLLISKRKLERYWQEASSETP